MRSDVSGRMPPAPAASSRTTTASHDLSKVRFRLATRRRWRWAPSSSVKRIAQILGWNAPPRGAVTGTTLRSRNPKRGAPVVGGRPMWAASVKSVIRPAYERRASSNSKGVGPLLKAAPGAWWSAKPVGTASKARRSRV